METVVALRGANCTDLGNSGRLAYLHGDKIRYSSQMGWLEYDGTQWRTVDEPSVVALARDIPRSILAEAESETDFARRRELAEWSAKSESASRLRAAVYLLQSEPGVLLEPEDLDRDPLLLNTENGTLDLTTGELLRHSAADLISMKTGTHYDPSATCPQWKAFVDSIMGGDREMVGFLQRWTGYTLTGCTSEQCFAFLSGTGRNGKGVYSETLAALMGSYANSLSQAAITVKFGDTIPNEWAAMRGKRLAYAGEVESSRTLDAALLKTLSGEDTMSVRFFRREFFQMKPQFKLLYSANGRPKVKDSSWGFWRRVRLVPFDQTFNKDDPRNIPDLRERLLGELPGILNWALQGFKDWRENGLQEPERVLGAVKEYRDGENSVKVFCDEAFQPIHGHTVPLSRAHERYLSWAKSSGERQMGRNTFAGELRTLGYDLVRQMTGMAIRDTAFLTTEELNRESM